MQRKRGKGRPKLPRDRVRKFSVHITVTLGEHRQIKRAAEAEDKSMSAWARQWVLKGLKRHRG